MRQRFAPSILAAIGKWMRATVDSVIEIVSPEIGMRRRIARAKLDVDRDHAAHDLFMAIRREHRREHADETSDPLAYHGRW